MKEEGRVLEERIEALEEINAGADELEGKLRDESEKLKKVKMAKERLESETQRLQEKFSNQEHRVENLHITWDDPNRNKILEGFTENSDPLWSKTPENSTTIQEIFSQYPIIASGFQVRHLATKNGFKNTLAEVCKMAIQKQLTLEQIKYKEEGIADLELAGVNIPWLKTLVAKGR
ncbi:hypothetical protein PTKIN_Ptkin12aG0014600 [Pterospermum kingtungense]